jgi:exosome complex component RRP43
VRTGDTTVICGVRGEILPVVNIPNYRPRATGASEEDGGQELKDYDLLVPNIELATGCAPQFLPGVPPTPLAQNLSTRVYSLLHACQVVQAEDMRIWRETATNSEDEEMEGEQEDVLGDKELVAYWTLYIDLLFVSFDGNAFDAAWAAVLAALKDTQLPEAWWDDEAEMIVCSKTRRRRLQVRGLPIACSAAVFLEKERGIAASGKGGNEGRHWLLLDPDRLEESLCLESITMVVDRSSGETRVKSLEKLGGVVMNPQLVRAFALLAEKRWDDFKKAMA